MDDPAPYPSPAPHTCGAKVANSDSFGGAEEEAEEGGDSDGEEANREEGGCSPSPHRRSLRQMEGVLVDGLYLAGQKY